MMIHRLLWMVFLISLVALPFRAAARDDSAQKAAAAALVDRATAFRLPEVQKLPWEEFVGRISDPFLEKRDAFYQKISALPDTPDRKEIIARMCQEYSEPESRRYLALAEESTAIRNFSYTRDYLSFIRSLPAASDETKALLLQREREGMKRFYGSYIEAYDFVMQKVDGVARQMAQRQWQCRSIDGKSMVGLHFMYADPRQIVDDYAKKRLAEWQEIDRGLDAGVEILHRTDEHRPHWPGWPPMNFHWELRRDPHPHYPEQGDVYITLCGLYTNDSVRDYLIGDLDSLSPEEMTQVEVRSDRNWALFIRDPNKPDGMIRVDSLTLRTPYGYYFLNVGCSTPTGLDRDGAWRVRQTMTYAVIDALTTNMAGDIPGETFQPLDNLIGGQLTLEAIHPATGVFTEFVELEPKGEKHDQCLLRVTLVDGEGKPVRGAKILFPKLPIGGLSAREATTGADGKATIRYTAPSEEELEKEGKQYFEQYISATEEKTGLKGDVVITVRSKKGTVQLKAKHPVVPAAERFENPIRLKLNLAEKEENRPYDVICRTTKPEGRLRLSDGQSGSEVKFKLRPGEDFTLTYCWTGDVQMEQPIQETIVAEVPEREVKAEVPFRVGIDLEIDQVAPKSTGPMYAYQLIPLNVFIKDNFHRPDEANFDLCKLLEAYDLAPGVTITPTGYSGVAADPVEQGIARSLAIWLQSPPEGTVPCCPWSWEENTVIHPNIAGGQDRWVLIRKGWQTPAEGLSAEYSFPGVQMLRRGRYRFTFQLITGDYDAVPENRPFVPSNENLFQVVEYETFGDEMSDRVFLPSIEIVSRILLPELGGKISDATGYALSYSLALYDVSVANKKGDRRAAVRIVTGLLLSRVGHQMNWVNQGRLTWFPVTDTTKNLWGAGMIADYGCTCVEELVKDEPPPPLRSTKAARGDDSPVLDGLKDLQGALEASAGTRLIVLQRRGLSSLQARLKDGTPIEEIPRENTSQWKTAQRMRTGEAFITIGSTDDDTIVLTMKGTGGEGCLYLVTADRIDTYPYPVGDWSAEATIAENASIAFDQRQTWQKDAARSSTAADADDGTTLTVELRVRVYGATEFGPEALAGARVVVRRSGQSIQQAVSQICGEQGFALIPLPEAGKYEILATVDGYVPAGRKVELTRGSVNRIELMLVPREDSTER